MSRIGEMQNLTEDLLRSYEHRMAGLTARHTAVAETLAGFGDAMSEMAAKQRATLVHAMADRRAKMEAMRANTQSTMRGINDARIASEAELRSQLDNGRADLCQRVGDLMVGIHQARVTMAYEQQATLSRQRATLRTETDGFLGNVVTARAAMAQAQRETLEMGRVARHAEVTATLGGFNAERRVLATERAELSHAWQSFTELMRDRRHGAASVAPGQVDEKPRWASPSQLVSESLHHPKSSTAGQLAEVPRDAETAPIQASGAAPEVARPATDEMVFSHLADHPDGLRLVELEEHFGAPRIRLANILSRLIEENKARKDDQRKLYFPT